MQSPTSRLTAGVAAEVQREEILETGGESQDNHLPRQNILGLDTDGRAVRIG